MNPQPDPNTATMVVILPLLVVFLYYFFKAYNNPPKKSNSDNTWDFFAHDDIYYHDGDHMQMIPAIDKSEPKPKPKKQPKANHKDHPLYNDCKDVLVSLGHKKSEASKLADNIFQSNPPKSVQDFLSMVY